jgi:hypothetical protein
VLLQVPVWVVRKVRVARKCNLVPAAAFDRLMHSIDTLFLCQPLELEAIDAKLSFPGRSLDAAAVFVP